MDSAKCVEHIGIITQQLLLIVSTSIACLVNCLNEKREIEKQSQKNSYSFSNTWGICILINKSLPLPKHRHPDIFQLMIPQQLNNCTNCQSNPGGKRAPNPKLSATQFDVKILSINFILVIYVLASGKFTPKIAISITRRFTTVSNLTKGIFESYFDTKP